MMMSCVVCGGRLDIADPSVKLSIHFAKRKEVVNDSRESDEP
jgi:hypothetical protein